MTVLQTTARVEIILSVVLRCIFNQVLQRYSENHQTTIVLNIKSNLKKYVIRLYKNRIIMQIWVENQVTSILWGINLFKTK